jgi:hypothetical protein
MSKIVDYSGDGVRRLSLFTGLVAAGAAAGSEIFQFRWTSSVKQARILAVEFLGLGATTNFAAGPIVIEGVIARSFTAAGTGGTAATITGNNSKTRTTQPLTLLGEARIATTAALGAGTKTLDTQGFGGVVTSSLTAASSAPVALIPRHLFKAADNAGQPIILAQNEGVIVRATVPGTGTWTAGVAISWVELG